jgi:hypothetical protein
MMIIDLPIEGGGAVRAGVVGSCRVYRPLGALARGKRAKRRFLADGVFSYTAPEAIQEFAYSRGQRLIPDRFAPLVLNLPSAGHLPSELPALIDSCQVYLVEISTLDHFACGDLCFNYPSIANRLVRGAGPGMMAWFRQLSEYPSSSAIVASALDSSRASGKAADAIVEEMLTSMIRVRTRPEALVEQFARTAFARDKRWIFQPLFCLPDRPRESDPKRAALRDHVADAATAAGMEFFDLTPLVAQTGRAAALDGGGVSEIHFAPDFLPIVGEALRDVLIGVSAS